jgi:hypothetical protein
MPTPFSYGIDALTTAMRKPWPARHCNRCVELKRQRKKSGKASSCIAGMVARRQRFTASPPALARWQTQRSAAAMRRAATQDPAKPQCRCGCSPYRCINPADAAAKSACPGAGVFRCAARHGRAHPLAPGKNMIPVVPEKGSVGASGDLAPLAHLFLPLIGLGEVWFDGKDRSTHEVLKKFGLWSRLP